MRHADTHTHTHTQAGMDMSIIPLSSPIPSSIPIRVYSEQDPRRGKGYTNNMRHADTHTHTHTQAGMDKSIIPLSSPIPSSLPIRVYSEQDPHRGKATQITWDMQTHRQTHTHTHTHTEAGMDMSIIPLSSPIPSSVPIRVYSEQDPHRGNQWVTNLQCTNKKKMQINRHIHTYTHKILEMYRDTDTHALSHWYTYSNKINQADSRQTRPRPTAKHMHTNTKNAHAHR